MGIAILESKNDVPISLNCHRPETSEVAFQGMQPQRRRVDIVERGGIVQPCENQAQAFALDSLNPA